MTNNKRSYSEMQNNQSNNDGYDSQRPSKRAKYSRIKPEPMSPPNSPPSISISHSTNSHTNSNSNSTNNSNTNSHSHSQTPSEQKFKRSDLFDAKLDETYCFTKPTSTISAPTLGNSALEGVWREKTQKALLTFQRRKKSAAELLLECEPNNAIMKLLLRESQLVSDENIRIRLQNDVLTLIYSSQSQQKQLMRSRNRWQRRNNQNNGQNQNQMYRYDVSWYDKLPGPQPHSITRQNLDRLRSYFYWVAEKSDGIRFQLLLSNSPSFEAYFVDRKFEFYKIMHPFYKKFLNDVNGSSLMDGELIINTENKLEYLVFDCVAMQGKSLSNECTSRRVESFENFVAKYRTDIGVYYKELKENENKKIKVEAPPILIRSKKHWKAHDIDILLNHITYSNGEYYFQNAQRKTKNDGLIFTPQENNYLMSYDPGALVKWKFLEKNTIDLKCKTPFIWRDKLDLYAGGKQSSDILFTQIDMKERNGKNRKKFNYLLNEMKRLSNHRNGFISSFIIECAWNFQLKQWELIQNRPDKHIANFITVCTDTLRVMMDNVTKHELIDACKPNCATNIPIANHNYANQNSNNYSQYR